MPGDVGWWGRARQGTSCLSGGNYYDEDDNVGDEEGEYDRFFNRLKLMSAYILYQIYSIMKSNIYDQGLV